MIEPTPINTLSSEILIRIFHIVIAQPCKLDSLISDNKQHYPRYPDYLAQVCTLWRRIAISSRLLWCHMDLSPNEPYANGLVTRAETHLARAGELPVELHIAAKDGWGFEHDELYWLISLVLVCVASLELTVGGPFRSSHRDAFGLLLRQRPTLTKLVLRSSEDYCNKRFLVADSFDITMAGNFIPLVLDSTEDDIESSFAPLTVLHLRSIFPLWSSTAYHGLVDLRLLSTGTWSYIREAELIAILKSSPRLRILHFGLEIVAPATEPVAPVDLWDLHVIKIIPIGVMSMLCPSSVLRLLAPGTKPLRLAFEGYHKTGAMIISELEQFFVRSRVARFYTRAVFLPLNLLLRHSAYLEQVVLDDFQLYPYGKIPPTWLEVDEFASLPRLRSLHITRSVLFNDQLHLLLRCCPDGLVLNDSWISHNSKGDHMIIRLSTPELLEAFPTVRTTDRTVFPYEAPTADWDILD